MRGGRRCGPDWSRAAIVAALAGAAGAASLSAQAESCGPAVAAIRGLEREIAGDVVRDSVGSIAAAVFVGDRVVWTGAFGVADRSRRILATPATAYRAGSVTKPVTALLLLRLAEEGVVALDGPVIAQVPELERLPPSPVAGAVPGAITYRQLASHTAGLGREPERRRLGRGPIRWWHRQAVRAIPWTAWDEAPGARYRYSNVGYALLGLALERAAGRPFEALVDSLVLGPLGMRSTGLTPDRWSGGGLAVGYVNVDGPPDARVPRAEHRGRGFRVPGGGLYSTVGDLARLGMALTGAAPLLPDTLRALMLAPASAAGDPAYGLGVQRLAVASAPLAGHSGTVPGYTAYLLVDTERDAGVVLLRNYNRGSTNLGAAATRLLLGLRDAPRGCP